MLRRRSIRSCGKRSAVRFVTKVAFLVGVVHRPSWSGTDSTPRACVSPTDSRKSEMQPDSHSWLSTIASLLTRAGL
jgi:hypothetical protein